MSSKTGFTLVELLVVIAIIAVLASLIIPWLGSAQEVARLAACGANLRNLCTSNSTYAADHNGAYAHPRHWVTNVYAHWQDPRDVAEAHVKDGTMWKYVGSLEVYCCPSFRSAACRAPKLSYVCGREITYPILDPPDNNLIRSYTINSNVGEYSGERYTVIAGKRVAKRCPFVGDVRRPQDLAMFAEESPWRIPIYAPHPMNDAVLYVPDASYIDAIADYHRAPRGSLNEGLGQVVYCDNHVQRRYPWHTQEDFRNEYHLVD